MTIALAFLFFLKSKQRLVILSEARAARVAKDLLFMT
jgi:hypothetical protein